MTSLDRDTEKDELLQPLAPHVQEMLKDRNGNEREYHYEQTFLQGHYRQKPCRPAMGAIFAHGLKNRTLSTDHILPEKTKRKGGRGRIKNVFRSVLEDWVFLAFLGIIMALLSLLMDMGIDELVNIQWLVYRWAAGAWHITYFVWIGYAVLLTLLSALFAHYIAPQAIGSGIPEMKTILRGVVLKEYLTFRTLVSKMVGLTLSLGSGLPIGKEGPFVHIASVVANLLSHAMHGSQGVYENESRSSEMLAAGCAVGVACTFSAPVGGVLFSIEVTSVYFAVRNYWRGFFAATCSATLFRILRVFFTSDVTVTAFFQTHFPAHSFFPEELPVFALIGLVCGLAGALFIFIQRNIVLFLRKNGIAKKLFQKYWLIYPAFIPLVVSSLTYPKGFGRFLAGELKFGHSLGNFFMDCTFAADSNATNACPSEMMLNWTGEETHSVFISLVVFQVVYFFLAIISTTLPVPAGIFMPVFVLGACFGRTIGELMALWFPEGLRSSEDQLIYPGVYAVVGAAAFCGSVTHTVSVAVIVFELTGQLLYILPVMIAVLIANAVCSYLQPSIYDSIIKIKHLPYLPDIPHTSSVYHRIQVDQIMVAPVRYVAKDSRFKDIQDLLIDMPRMKSFPVVESRGNKVLLGSIGKSQLHKLLEAKVGLKARQHEATRRVREAIDSVDKRMQLGQNTQSGVAVGKKRTAKSRFTIVQVEQPPEDTSHQQDASSSVTVLPNDSRLSGLHGNHLTVGPILSNVEKEAIFAMGKKRNASDNFNSSSVERVNSQSDVYNTIGGMFRSITKMSFHRQQKKQAPENDFDLYGEDRDAWESEMLNSLIDIRYAVIDPAPFQLVEHTSLFKVHSLFSLLGLNRAYVTECGRLIGVVALRELRVSIEQAQNGVLQPGETRVDNDTISLESSDFEDKLQPRLEVISQGTTVNSMSDLLERKQSQATRRPVLGEAVTILNESLARKLSIGDIESSIPVTVPHVSRRAQSVETINVHTLNYNGSAPSHLILPTITATDYSNVNDGFSPASSPDPTSPETESSPERYSLPPSAPPRRRVKDGHPRVPMRTLQTSSTSSEQDSDQETIVKGSEPSKESIPHFPAAHKPTDETLLQPPKRVRMYIGTSDSSPDRNHGASTSHNGPNGLTPIPPNTGVFKHVEWCFDSEKETDDDERDGGSDDESAEKNEDNGESHV